MTNKNVKMPAGIRNKLVAALCMLLVSTIMLVSATYAWFTLSTAPEVTGITTSVGANGNLEIALLTTDTYSALASITSAVGDSSAVKGTVASNITWGNLVDLSDVSYGLNSIKLNQSMANIDNGIIDVANPLKTAVYGADGRVASVGGTIVSAVKDATTGAFTYTSGSQTYGVRAVGEASNLSPRQITFNSARSAVTSNQNNAKNATKNAIAGASSTFLAIALAGSTPSSYSYGQVEAVRDIANGLKSSFNSVTLVFANAGIATAASGSTATDEQLDVLKAAVTSDAAAMKAALNTAGVATFDGQLDAIASAQTTVNSALTGLNTLLEANTEHTAFDQAADITAINGYIESLIGSGATSYTAYDANDQVVTGDSTTLMETAKKVYMTAGALSTLTTYTGNFEIVEVLGIRVFAGAADAVPSFPDVSGLTAPAGAAASNISDSYGYIIDFAFRTNAADSNLQLQTTAANRVYSDANDADLATMGAGSTVEFTYGEETSVTQATNLLNNVKFIFFDPEAGTVYAQGKLDNVDAASGSATANVILVKEAGEDADDIVALNQNEIKRVSVLVYLDGETLTNADVANAASSGTLDLNLQFSSSATLVPMENTALRNMVNS